MSKLQKKKPQIEKKKKKAAEETEAGNSSAGVAVKKSAAAVSLKSKGSKENLSDGRVKEPNIFERAVEFLREVKVELKKVTWPTRKQTTGTTIVVIIFVFIVAAFLGIFDFGLSKLVQVVLT